MNIKKSPEELISNLLDAEFVRIRRAKQEPYPTYEEWIKMDNQWKDAYNALLNRMKESQS